MRWTTLHNGPTVDDLREAVTTLESVAKSWTRASSESSRDAEGPERAGYCTKKLARAAAGCPSPSRRRALSLCVS